MLLRPVSAAQPPALRDADAAAPDGVPLDEELQTTTAALLDRAATLQSALYAERRRAVLFVLQGRDAAGKDGIIRKVFSAMHPQGLHLRSFGVPEGEEAQHHFLWRLQRALPPFGRVGVWNRSHYEDILVPRVHGTLPPRVWRARYAEINAFEHAAHHAGIHIVKLFVHISRAEQRERFQERAADRSKQWKVQASDLRDRAKWPAFTRAYRDLMRHCSTRHAPWYVVPADRKAVRDYLVARLLVHVLSDMRPAPPPIDPALAAAVRRLR